MFQSQLNAPKLAIVKGNEGEDFVLSCLKEAFPNNTGIIKTSEHKCGDIIFRVENSDKLLMFEVKNTNRNVNAINNGKDYEKFFSDLHNPSINLSGGILISLNGTVDINTPSREPRLDRGKPFMFIDNLKQFPDPVCLLHVVVTMMIFMVKYSGSLQDTNLRLQLDTYAKQTERLMKVYKELMYNHKKQAKNIESLRSEIEDMQYILTGTVSFHKFVINKSFDVLQRLLTLKARTYLERQMLRGVRADPADEGVMIKVLPRSMEHLHDSW